jgi:molybdate transport system substrate-binding protein
MSGPRFALAVGLLACLAVLGACGDSGPQLRVSAASSLRHAFTRYAQGFTRATVSSSFAGSDALAAQIENGARPDVFAAANLKLPARLYAEHLVDRPVEFARNTLVLAVPRRSAIGDLAQLTRPGVTVATGTPTVPIGAYTQAVMSRMAPAQRRALLANVRDRESDVTGIVAKLTQGAVDAGFVYATDVAATHGSVRAIALPAALRPRVGYAAAVVRGSRSAGAARAFVDGLLSPGGRSALRASGFLAPGDR